MRVNPSSFVFELVLNSLKRHIQVLLIHTSEDCHHLVNFSNRGPRLLLSQRDLI